MSDADQDRAKYLRFLKVLGGVAVAFVGGVAAIVATEKAKAKRDA